MRAYRRYPVSLDAVLITPEGREVAASVADLSLGGAGIQTREDVSQLKVFVLEVIEPGWEFRCECAVRHVTELWTSSVIHAQFLDDDSDGRIHQIVDSLSLKANSGVVIPIGERRLLKFMRRVFPRKVA